MLKPVITATAILALAGSSLVYAQQGPGHGGYGNGQGGDNRHAEHRHRPSPADRAAFTDARIAALKAGLELTPDQAKNWPAFEQAIRDMAQLRAQRMQARQAAKAGQGDNDQQKPASPFDRLEHRADNMSKTGAALKKMADAGGPLYQSLTDEQKGRFKQLARILRPHHLMHAQNEGGGRQGRADEGGQGREGHGWGHGGRHFGQNDGSGGRMHNLADDNSDQGSRL
jgi:hypothetical protein